MLHAFSDIVMNGDLVPYGNKDIVYRNMKYEYMYGVYRHSVYYWALYGRNAQKIWSEMLCRTVETAESVRYR